MSSGIDVTADSIGLASAILIDAFIVRTMIVPSLMHLSGSRNWELPKWLDRIVPHIHVETADAGVPPGPPVPAGAVR